MKNKKLRDLKPRDTVLERKNLKRLELLVINDGKKIKIILTLGLKLPYKSSHKEEECFFYHPAARQLEYSPVWSNRADDKKASTQYTKRFGAKPFRRQFCRFFAS